MIPGSWLAYWDDLLGNETLAMEQAAYERGECVVRMRRAGLIYQEIGGALGVGTNRARQLFAAHLRRRCAPAEKHFREFSTNEFSPTELKQLRKFFGAR